MSRIALVALAALFSVPLAAQTPTGIDSVFVVLRQGFQAKDLVLVKSVYTDEGCHPRHPCRQRWESCGKVKGAFDAIFREIDSAEGALDITFVIEDYPNSEVSYALGTFVQGGYFKLTESPPNGEPLQSYGRFGLLLRRSSDGRWMIHREHLSEASAEAFEAARDASE